MRSFRRGGRGRAARRPNGLIGLFLLVLLAVFAGPNMYPRLVANTAPGFIDEGVACTWLREGQDRGNHQSLIGRSANQPIGVSVRSSAVPATLEDRLTITIIVVNQSLGTVPFLYNPDQVIIGDDGSSGLGLIFDPPIALTNGATRPSGLQSYDEANIRLLGPRQRCVHKVNFDAAQIQLDQTINSGTVQVRAYYRNNAPGLVIQSQDTIATPVYSDQGLWVGFTESAAVNIPSAFAAP